MSNVKEDWKSQMIRNANITMLLFLLHTVAAHFLMDCYLCSKPPSLEGLYSSMAFAIFSAPASSDLHLSSGSCVSWRMHVTVPLVHEQLVAQTVEITLLSFDGDKLLQVRQMIQFCK